MKKQLLTLLVLCALMPIRAFAHDERLHGGKPIAGEIVSVEPGRLVLESEGVRRNVTLDAKTRIELDGVAGTSDELRPGRRAAVIGTKLPGGEIVAREVLVRADPAQGHDPGRKAADAEGDARRHHDEHDSN